MQKLSPSLFVAALGIAFAGCYSDGQVGENGLVRFSQVMDYADTADFSAPVAVERTLLVALQEPARPFDPDQETMADLTVEVRRKGKKQGAVFPLGFAQYAVLLEEDGPHELVALRDGVLLDRVQLNGTELHRLRLSAVFELVTHDKANNCVQWSRNESGLEGFVLHENQKITVFVVPEDGDGRAQLGHLGLTAHAPGFFQLDAPIVGRGIGANALTLSAKDPGGFGGEEQIVIREAGLKDELVWTLRTTRDSASVSCPKN